MAENLSIARPYADAAFRQAKESKALGSWLEALERLVAVVNDASMKKVVDDPKITDDQLYKLIIGILGEDVSADQKNFVNLLVQNERLSVLPEILEVFVDKKNAEEGVLDAVVTSAFEMDDKTIAKLKADLEDRFQTKLTVQVQVDPELIGGVRITVGDDVIDTSVRGKLASMAAALKN